MNQREMDVLNILWKSDEPMMATDIVTKRHDLTQSTVTAVLRKLLENELVEVVGVTHSGRVLSRTYKATEKAKQAIMDYFLEQYESIRDVISPCDVCYEIVKNNREERLKLMKLLDNLQK